MAISAYYGLLSSLKGFNYAIVSVHIYKHKKTGKLSLIIFPSELIFFHLQKANYEEDILVSFFTETCLKKSRFFFFPKWIILTRKQ